MRICKFGLSGLVGSALLLAAAIVSPSVALAQSPPPGWIFELDTTHPGTLPTYTLFTTTFIGDGNTEFVSFAFREAPAYFAFDNASVTTGGGSNLLADPGFESASSGQNCNHNNALGCPAGWSAWIQPVDTSAIGQVATTSSPYGCNVAAFAGTNFWCDGSVQGYDAVYQAIPTTNGATYTVSFELQDDSGSPMNNPSIDMFVYAGDNIPVGTVSIGTAPEPSSFLLLGLGLAALFFLSPKQRLRRLA